MADTTPLAPCPFCGGPVQLEEASPTRDRLYVARAPLTDEQIDQAIAELGLNYLADAHATNRAVLRKLCRHANGIT